VRILFLLTQDLESPSGLGRYLPLAKELTRLGHTVTIAALHSNYQSLVSRRFNFDEVDVLYVSQMHVQKTGNIKQYFPAGKLLFLTAAATWRLSKAAINFPADIVHIAKPHPMNSIAGLLSKRDRKRIYLDCDDNETASLRFYNKWQSKIIRFFELRMPGWVDYVTTNTMYTYNRLNKIGIPSEKILYLSNGVDLERFKQPKQEIINALQEKHFLANKKVISFIGSLSESSHPISLLITAFAHLAPQSSDYHLMLVGGGEDFNQYNEQIKGLGLSDRVTFIGRVPPVEVVNYYYLSDVTVDPVFDDEAAKGRSPLKLFESWACGVPFVTSDVGDRKLLMGSPQAGVLTKPGDPINLSVGINEVLSNKDLSKSISLLGRERVFNYTWDKLALKLDSFYRDNFAR
jgi:glycosyltransferase involved in cell wall biosynthesis